MAISPEFWLLAGILPPFFDYNAALGPVAPDGSGGGIDLATGHMGSAHLVRQGRSMTNPGTGFMTHPGIEATACDLQDVTLHGHRWRWFSMKACPFRLLGKEGRRSS